MTETAINIILCVPFLLVAIVTGIIYLISGFRKGLWHALVSLGVTVVSILVSLLLANLAASLLSGVLVNAIPQSIFAQMPAFSGMAKSFIKGLIQDVLSLIFFSLFFFICLIVLKLVGNRIVSQIEKLQVSEKGMKFAGMGVRLVDTLLVTFLLLLPLYGSISTYMTPVVKAKTTNAQQLSTTDSMLLCVVNHPLVRSYDAGPGEWLYSGLSGFKVNETRINLPEMADTLETTLDLIMEIEQTANEEKVQATLRLNKHLRDNVIESEWCYSLICSVVDEVEVAMEQYADENTQQQAQPYLDLFDMSQKEFESNGMALVDFITYALEHEFMEFYKTSNYEILSQEFLTELGDLINYSDQATALKKLITIQAMASFYEEYDYENYDPTTYEDAMLQAQIQAGNFVDDHWGDGKVPQEQRIREAQAFMVMMFENDKSALLEAFSRNPMFGPEVMKPFLKDTVAEEYAYLSSENQTIEQWLDKHPNALKLAQKRLDAYTTAPLSNQLFNAYLESILSMERVLDGERLYYWTMDPHQLAFLLDHMSKSDFTSGSIACGEELYQLLRDFRASHPDRNFSINISDLITLMDAAKRPENWPTKEVENPWAEGEDNITEEKYQRYEAYQDFISAIRSQLNSPDFPDLVGNMITDKGADPLGLGKDLSAKQKSFFKRQVESALEDLKKDDFSFSGMGGADGSGVIIGGIGSGSGVIIGGIGSGSGFISGSGGLISGSGGLISGSGLGIGGITIVGGADSGNGQSFEEFMEEYRAMLEENAALLLQLFGVK